METIVVIILAFFIIVAVPLTLGLLEWRSDVKRYNKSHVDKRNYTSPFVANRRYRDWYIANFCDKEDIL